MDDATPDRDSSTDVDCSIARALDFVGTRSAILVLREAFLGTRRFDDFAKRVGIGEPATATRLREMTRQGLLERVPYREPGQRTRYEYRLTPMGRTLLPVITALRQWGDEWAAGPAGPPLEVVHRDCGSPVHAEIRCEAGHDVGPDELEAHPRSPVTAAR